VAWDGCSYSHAAMPFAPIDVPAIVSYVAALSHQLRQKQQ
jgi:hypothetical protein